ncbi:MAG: hypothetical protein U9P42_07415 [Candidatus Fermentibacteria bacterium]|nr:hypothetical protein [Candidatus Fermentibacteria bacterium]
MKFLNWPHVIIGFLIGVALILYMRSEGEAEEVSVSVQNSIEKMEVHTE